MEASAVDYIRRIDEMGGMIKAIEQGFPQKEIAEAAYHYQKQVDDGEKTVVGVNRYTEGDDHAVNLLRIGPEVERAQLDRLRRTRAERDAARFDKSLRDLEAAARNDENLMPHILEAVRAYGSVQEICDTLKNVSESIGNRRFNCDDDTPPIRLLVGKVGLDGHDRGAKIIARALRDGGFEVIYSGLHQTPEMVVATALQEDVDGIGLSILSGAHNTIFPKVLRLLKEKGGEGMVVFGGGIIPDEDIETLRRDGVAGIFTPGATTREVIDWVRANVASRNR